MISEEIQEMLANRLVKRIEKMNEDILTIIGNRLKQIGKLSQDELHQIKQMLMYGTDLDKIAKLIADTTNVNVAEIYKIFEQEAKTNQAFAMQFYRAKQVKFVPYAENKLLQAKVRAMAQATAMEYVNMSRTLAFVKRDKSGKIVYDNIATAYRNAVDKAVTSISMGQTTYDEEIKRIVKELGESGIKTVDYVNGYSRRLDSAVRQNVLEGMRNVSNELQKDFGKEFGADGVEISVHENSAPDHIDIQGHQFSYEEFDKFQNGITAKDYNGKVFEPVIDEIDRRSIGQYNCYHYVYTIVLGVSTPQYTEEELEKINKRNIDGFEYKGKKYTMYEGTQMQRQIETEIRKNEDFQILANSAGDLQTAGQANKAIRILKSKYKQLSRASGLPNELLSRTGYRIVAKQK